MNRALLIIDMQEVCVGKQHADYFKYSADLLPNVNEVIDENKDGIIIYIRNVMKRNLLNKLAPFHAYEGTPEVELAKELHIVSEFVFDKYVGNALTNKELVKFLEDHKVNELELVGVDGAGCVAMTAYGACKMGYQVKLNKKAIGTISKEKQTKCENKLAKLGAQFM